jgi:hypothetical protein
MPAHNISNHDHHRNHSLHMKPSKSARITLALLLVAAVCIGASQGGAIQSGHDRPPGVAEEKWVPIGKRAGFVMRSDPDARVPVA